jgi:hypothetical protein
MIAGLRTDHGDCSAPSTDGHVLENAVVMSVLTMAELPSLQISTVDEKRGVTQNSTANVLSAPPFLIVQS